MQNLLFTKILLSATSALMFIGALALTTPNVHADVTYNTHSDNDISISISDDHNEKIYRVNNKQFSWHDLTAEQKSKVTLIEDKIKKVERSFNVQEKQLSIFAKQLEEKAQIIEDEVNKLEQVSVKFDKENINLNDLNHLANELAKLSSVNEKLLRIKELEIHEIEKKMEAVDLSLIGEIEIHAKELEQVLIEIAQTI
ncbi:MAG: hypothetical protein KC484_05160 [Colwelliaceae bacterium]|nr:hypothetical protein [Colwelliaceae bacterium]